MQDSRPPIYSLTIDIAVKKGKHVYEKEAWAVCRYDTPHEIMNKSKHTMDRLKRENYPKGYKGEKKIIVRKIRSKKHVGYVNSNAI